MDLCTFYLAGYMLGIDALEVQEIMPPQRITRVPLAPAAIAGLLNVRGELVTAIDLRRRLELPPREAGAGSMNIVVRTAEGPVSLIVDAAGEVLKIGAGECEPVPPTLRGPVRALTEGVVKLHDRLLLRLNTPALLGAPTGDARGPGLEETI